MDNNQNNLMLFRALVDQANDAIEVLDPVTGRFLDVNEKGCKDLGYSREELLKLSVFDIDPMVNPSLFRKIAGEISGGDSKIWEGIHLRKDGSTFPVEVTLKMVELEKKYMITVVRDITPRKQVMEALKRSEQRYRDIFNHAPVGIYQATRDGKFITVNDQLVRILEYGSIDELMQIDLAKDIYFDQGERDLLIAKYEPGAFISNIEVRWKKKDGTPIWIGLSSHAIKDNKNKTLFFEGFVQDIKQRRQAEDETQKERKLLRTLIDNLPYPIYVKDNEARKVIANIADVENIGCLNEAEALGKTDIELFAGETGLRGYADDKNVIQTGSPVINREEIFLDKNGIQRWLLTSKIPLFDEQGKISGLVGIGRDITYRKKAEEQIQKLTKSVEQSPSSIIITDVDGIIEYVNPKFLEITGYSKEEVIGRNPNIQKSGEVSEEVYKQLWETVVSGDVWRGELINRKKNGELYWEWATIASIKNDAGIVTNYIAIKEDISDRKQMEADLIIAKEKAEESDRLKSAFLANMSHEIRTPLNSIIGFSELLAEDRLDPERKKEFLTIITETGNSLLAIISDIMDLSKMESGQIVIKKSKIPVNRFLSSLAKKSAFQFREKNIEIKINLTGETEDCQIMADEERLSQIFNNLTNNAVKFSEKQNLIQVGVKNKNEMTEFYVKDNGIGIPKEFHEIIFDRFRQVETTKSRKYGGNGLGLAISKYLVELMGGTIRLDSEPGKGSTFFFTVPRYID
jgi:hypothetical protein